jgi:Domain of unknown function (DUF4148)
VSTTNQSINQSIAPARLNRHAVCVKVNRLFLGTNMKTAIRLITFSILAILQLTPAHAERFAFDWERPGYQEPNAQPAKSRAQVIDELAQARSSGELDVQDNDYPHSATDTSMRTRKEVKQEALSAPNQSDSSLSRNQ